MSTTPHTPASTVLRSYLDLIGRDIDRWTALLDDDVVIDFPYSKELGLPMALNGKAAAEAHMRRMTSAMEGLRITGVTIYPAADPNQAFAEFHADALVGPSRAPYSQDYIVFMQVRDGKVIRYREYWDPIRVQGAVSNAARQEGQV